MRTRAFTLIELLTCIAIVILLLAILLPGLRGARREAQSAVCGSNLRSIGQAFHAFRSQYPNRAPVGFTGLGYDEVTKATRCAVDPAEDTHSYSLLFPTQPSTLVKLEAQAITQPLASDRKGAPSPFRHGLKVGEALLGPFSEQWKRTWRNHVFIDGHVQAMRGPYSGDW